MIDMSVILKDLSEYLRQISSPYGIESAKKLIGLAVDFGFNSYIYQKASYGFMEKVSATDVVDETGDVVVTICHPNAFIETVYMGRNPAIDTTNHTYTKVEKLPEMEIEALYTLRQFIENSLTLGGEDARAVYFYLNNALGGGRLDEDIRYAQILDILTGNG